jgi:hypothetical protein
MTLMRDLVADTRRMAYGSMADQLNFLAADAPLGAGELFMSMDVENITPGMTLSSGLNVYYVIGTEPALRRVVVYASYDNSRNDALPVGSPVMIRPRVTDWLLFQNVNDIIKAMSSTTHGLYRFGSWEDQNTNQVWGTYPIPPEAANMTNLIRVQAKYFFSTDLWVDVPVNMIDWQPERGIIRLKSFVPNGMPVRFDYRAPFKPAAGLTDDVVVDCGLSETMLDIPPLGAAARLLRTTESRRVQIHNQGDSRRAGEVSATANSRAADEMGKDFKSRVNDEYARLLQQASMVRAIP